MDGCALMRTLATLVLIFNGGRHDDDDDEDSDDEELEEGEEASDKEHGAEGAPRKRAEMPGLFTEVPESWRRCFNALSGGDVRVGSRAVAATLPAMMFVHIGEEGEAWVARQPT